MDVCQPGPSDTMHIKLRYPAVPPSQQYQPTIAGGRFGNDHINVMPSKFIRNLEIYING